MSSVMFVRDLVNRGVMNDKGEKLGKIRAIAVNMDSGRIAYAVLSFGGFLNLPKLFAIPWELMRYSSHDRRFILNVPNKTLASGLAFDTLEQVLAGANFSWLGDVYEYFSDKPDWEQKRQQQIQQDIDEAQRRKVSILGEEPSKPQ
jgi:sporulation protein YlmC with PRC-barrel domain